MNLLAAVFDYLHAREIGAAAIGGVALAAHGIVRATVQHNGINTSLVLRGARRVRRGLFRGSKCC